MIHSTAIIGPDVRMEGLNEVGAYTVIQGRVTVGYGVKIGSHCTIGNRPQHKAFQNGTGSIMIRANTEIMNYVSIDLPTTDLVTHIGKNCYIMHYAHISHDTYLCDNITICNAVQIGGHTTIGDGCVLSLGCTVEQRSKIGQYNFFSMGSKIRDVKAAFGKYVDGRRIGDNEVAIERNNFTPEMVEQVKSLWRDVK
jgi:UDP-N-acetylglucosamine acyltransferase